MEPGSEPDLVPLRDYCRSNSIGISTAYRLAAVGKLKITHIGKRSYLTRETRAAFLKSLEQPAA